MELVEGANHAGPLPVETAIGYTRRIAAGLEAAREKGNVHWDLKPANIPNRPGWRRQAPRFRAGEAG